MSLAIIPISRLIGLVARAGLTGGSLERALKLIYRYKKGKVSPGVIKKELSLILRCKTALYRGTGKVYKPNKEGMYTGKFPNKFEEKDWNPNRLYVSKQKRLARKFPRNSRELEDEYRGYVQKFEVPNRYLKKHGKTRDLTLREIVNEVEYERDGWLDWNAGLLPTIWVRGETFFNKGIPKKYLKEVVKKTSKRLKDATFSTGGKV